MRYFASLLIVAAVAWSAPAIDAAPKVTFAGGVLPTPSNRPNAEPGMAIDGGGDIWVSSFTSGHPPDPAAAPNDHGELPGTGIWRSKDGGATFKWVADPWKAVEDLPGAPFAGNDSDIAAAPVKNVLGFYNVYAVALYPSNASIAWSPDGGATWIRQPIAGITGFPFDRPWATADGPCSLFVAYHSGQPWIIQRYDFCDPSNTAVAIDPVTSVNISPDGPIGASALVGKIHADTKRHRVYLPMETCTGPLSVGAGDGDNPLAELGIPVEAATAADSGCVGGPHIAVGLTADGGRTWTSTIVAPVANGAAPIWPATVATDDDGTVYIAWFDDHDAYLSRSTDGGQRWSAPVSVNAGGAMTAVYPTVAATGRGNVAVAYYGTTRDGDANDASLMGPPSTAGSAEWRLWWATSKDGGRRLTNYVASPVIHTGVLCTHGGSCSTTNSRNLFDDFGMVFSRTGKASIAYTTDRVPVTGEPTGTLDTTFTAYATQR